MTKEREALKLALEALGNMKNDPFKFGLKNDIDKAITAIKEALVNEALDKMAENARELGLDYEPEQKPCCYGGIAHDCHAGEGCRIVKRMKAAQTEQETVAWRAKNFYENQEGWFYAEWHQDGLTPQVAELLYTTPPQRKPLTDEQRDAIARQAAENDWHDYEVIDAVEAAHGIKGEA